MPPAETSQGASPVLSSGSGAVAVKDGMQPDPPFLQQVLNEQQRPGKRWGCGQ